MLSSILFLLVCVLFGVALGDLLRSEPARELNGTTARARELQSQLGKQDPGTIARERELQSQLGFKQVPNNCASVFSRGKVNDRTCAAPCNNPCVLLSTTGYGCGAGYYCSCAAGVGSKPNVVRCLSCPYITAKGTTCPGDGFVYDKSLPSTPVKAPTRSAPTSYPKCSGINWGTCVLGEYCLKKADFNHVCTTCPTGLICIGDGTRVSPPPPPSPVRGPK
jgi:hypothetical protein